jgi:hypothetical protein
MARVNVNARPGVSRRLDRLECRAAPLEGFLGVLVTSDDHVLTGDQPFIAEPRDLCRENFFIRPIGVPAPMPALL